MKHTPQLVVDARGLPIFDGIDADVGLPPQPQRMVAALPLNKAGGPVQVAAAQMIEDPLGRLLIDGDGNLVGDPGVFVHRLLAARWTGNTRQLAG